VVLDPFLGSGTTALVAGELGRRFVGIELHPDYLEMSRSRLLADSFIQVGPSLAENADQGAVYASL
jgi:modification methylase